MLSRRLFPVELETVFVGGTGASRRGIFHVEREQRARAKYAVVTNVARAEMFFHLDIQKYLLSNVAATGTNEIFVPSDAIVKLTYLFTT